MPSVTLSSKNQITLPADIVRRLELKGGDKLVAELIDDHIVLMPQPESWVDYFSGRLKGVWGDTVEEIDRYIAEGRGTYERGEWLEQFDDLVQVKDPDSSGKIVEYLKQCPYHTAPESDIRSIPGIDDERVNQALQELVRHGGVRKVIPSRGVGPFGGYTVVYKLVRDFVGKQ